MKLLFRFFDRIEAKQAPLWSYLLSFVFIALIRNLLELFSSSNFFCLADNLHFIMFYVALGLCVTPLVTWLTGLKVTKAVRLVLLGFVVILAGPLIDLSLHLEAGPVIGYIWPGLTHSLWMSYFSFFGSGGWVGVTWGIRIELFLLLVVFFLFVLKKAGWGKALLSVLLFYSLLFLFAITPFWLSAFYRLLGVMPAQGLTSYDFIYIFTFIAAMQLVVVFALMNPAWFKALFNDLRVERMLHFFLIFVLGAFTARYRFFAEFQWSSFALWGGVFTLLSVACAILFSIITNNIEDRGIDAVSNPGRPIVQNTIPRQTYTKLAVLAFLLANFCAAIVSWKLWFFIMIFTGAYFLYSVPPFRLKRVPVFSKVVIGFNTLVLFMLGYEYFSLYSINLDNIITSDKFLVNFPTLPFWVFLVGFSLCANFIDIKDIEGDKAGGIRTLPGLVGGVFSRWIIGLMFLIFYGLVYFILPDLRYYVPLAVLGLLQFYLFALRRQYKERIVFYTYLASMSLVVVYYYFKP